MKYEHIQVLSDESFRRATGVKKKTFNRMLEIIKQEEVKRKKQGGRPNKLSVEDRLLMTLEYLREYRTFFHISKSYGISESSCYDNIQHIENALIKDGTFNLPKRKEMLMSDTPIEIVLIDASETPIERPKKKD
jgi:hypothetical protein